MGIALVDGRGLLYTWCQRMLRMEVVSWAGLVWLVRMMTGWMYGLGIDRWMDVPCQDMMDVVCEGVCGWYEVGELV